MQFDLAGKTAMADRMIVASGTSTRQVTAMADHLVSKLKALGLFARSEGKKQGDWVLVDAGDVVVHLFRPEVRAFYDIERLWAGQTPMALNLPAPKPVITVSTAPVATSMAEKSVVKKVAKKTAKKTPVRKAAKPKSKVAKPKVTKPKARKPKRKAAMPAAKKPAARKAAKPTPLKRKAAPKKKAPTPKRKAPATKKKSPAAKKKIAKRKRK